MPGLHAVLTTAAAGLLALIAAQDASADTVVKVSLWDKGESSMEGADAAMPMGMAVEGMDMSMAKMGITLSTETVPAGEVTFQITNDSGAFYHEVVISAVSDPSQPLPYLAEAQQVDEDAYGRVAELGELKSHASKTAKATLTPGTYILYCNIAGHYAMGMWTLLTVTD